MLSLSEKAAEQAQVHTHNIAQRDSLITEQTKSLERLRQDMLLMAENFNVTVQAEISRQMEKMAVSTYTLHRYLAQISLG